MPLRRTAANSTFPPVHAPGATQTGARLERLLEQIPHRIRQIEPRRGIRAPGASLEDVMFVRSGLLSKYKDDNSGGRQIVALRFPGEIIRPGEGRAWYGLQAIVRSEILVGSGEHFNELVAFDAGLQRFVRALVQRDEAISYEWLLSCGRRDSTARVAHLLCEIAVRSGVDPASGALQNPFTQQQIADITGQTSVNVNRVFADLERQGLIERRARQIVFTDWDEFRQLARFQSEYLELPGHGKSALEAHSGRIPA